MMFLILYILFIAYTSEYDLQWDDVLSISIDDIYRYRVLVILAFFDLISNVLLLYFDNVSRTLYTTELLPYLSWPLLIIANKLYWHQMY